MAEDQQPEQDPGEEFTREEVSGFQGALLEIDAASADLGEFIRWVAAHGEDDDDQEADEFTVILNYVYSFCRTRNDKPIEGTAEDESDPGPRGD